MVDAIHMLLYGESGSGKSTLASTWPGPTLWLICSGGNKPGELKSIDTPENRKKITPRIIESLDQMHGYVEEAKGYTTTVLDHVSGLADLLLKELLGLDEIPVQKSWGMASQATYGQLAQQCKEIFRHLLNLSGHVILIAQQRTFGGKDEGGDPDIIKPTVGAALQPSLTGWLNPSVDYLCQCYRRPKMKRVKTGIVIDGKDQEMDVRDKGVEYCLRTSPSDTYHSKMRIPRGREIPECITDPSYTKFMKLIKG